MYDEQAGEGDLHGEPGHHLAHPPRIHPKQQVTSVLRSHKRRMETEDKAKVVASAWGAKFIQFLAGLAVLPQSIWKKLLNSAGLFGRNG